MKVVLGEVAPRAVVEAHVSDPGAYAIVLRARRTRRGILLVGDGDDLEELRDHVAAAANHEPRRARQRVLDGAYARLAAALGWTG